MSAKVLDATNGDSPNPEKPKYFNFFSTQKTASKSSKPSSFNPLKRFTCLDTMSDSHPKFKIYKNIVALSSAFFLLFASFQAISALQTSINATKGLGSISLSVIYAFFIASCIFLPELLITYLTIKWTLFWCVVTYSTYIAANFKPTWWTLMPTSALLGLAAGPLWTSQSVYITHLGKKLTKLNRTALKASPGGGSKNKSSNSADKDNRTAMVPFLFGIFFAFFQTGTICGQLISSLTLRGDLVVAKNHTTSFDGLSNYSRPVVRGNSTPICGFEFCSNKAATESNLFRPSKAKLYTLYSIYTCLALLASLVIALFLDNYSTEHSSSADKYHENDSGTKNKEEDSDYEYDQFTNTPSPVLSENEFSNQPNGGIQCDNKTSEKIPKPVGTSYKPKKKVKPTRNSVRQMCFATLNQMRKWQQLCLIPLSIYSGLQQGFMSADFTKAYVACNYGVWYLGFVMMVYAFVNACVSPLSGIIGKRIPRWIIFLFSALVHAFGVIPFLTLGSRSISLHFGLMFFVAGLFGLFDGIWQPQINGLYSNLFQDNAEPAFANHRLWESIGFIISFSYHELLCIRSKLIVLVVFLLLGSASYTVLEIRLRKATKNVDQVQDKN